MFAPITKAAPQLLASHSSFLNKMVASGLPQGARQFSMAFNFKSKFEEAYDKKMAAQANVPKKM